mmetsp:Transcript_7871/g.15337  ORF Transcript_7871/g.15337 Transcript_7871/m.15337 type:complete len:465 (-) Transcript_7871:627-2021(-)
MVFSCLKSHSDDKIVLEEVGQILVLGLEKSGKTLLAKQLQVASGICPPHRKLERADAADSIAARSLADMAATANSDTVSTIGTEMFLIGPPPRLLQASRAESALLSASSSQICSYSVKKGHTTTPLHHSNTPLQSPPPSQSYDRLHSEGHSHQSLNIPKISGPPLTPNLRISLREVGGSMLPLWPQYFDGAKALIFCIDASDGDSLALASVELWDVLQSPIMSKLPICVVLTKIPPPSPLHPSSILSPAQERNSNFNSNVNSKFNSKFTSMDAPPQVCSRLHIDLVSGLSSLMNAFPEGQFQVKEVNSLVFAKNSAFEDLVRWNEPNWIQNPAALSYFQPTTSLGGGAVVSRSRSGVDGKSKDSVFEFAPATSSPAAGQTKGEKSGKGIFGRFGSGKGAKKDPKGRNSNRKILDPLDLAAMRGKGAVSERYLNENERLELNAMQDLLGWCWEVVDWRKVSNVNS